MAEPEAMQQAGDIGTMNAHPARLQLGAQLVQCQFPCLSHPLAHKGGMRGQLATARRMALAARLKRSRFSPELHQLVHETGRDTEMPCGLRVAVPLVDIPSNTLTQRHR
ncbi:hypothetical protein [Nitratireductor sp. GCM10026969]|uniref:hypothetical protein n=1 Tax=Nitratireductor sp. GCM10026969 TaxID=3252645 RepID=UPI003623045C